MLIDHVFVSIEIIQQVGLIALKSNEMDIAYNLWLDGFESFGMEKYSIVLDFDKGDKINEFW